MSEATARCAAELVGANFKTAAYYFYRLRTIIERATQDETHFAGEVEVDESYFGRVRKDKRVRGAADKVPVFLDCSNAALGYMRRSFPTPNATP